MKKQLEIKKLISEIEKRQKYAIQAIIYDRTEGLSFKFNVIPFYEESIYSFCGKTRILMFELEKLLEKIYLGK